MFKKELGFQLTTVDEVVDDIYSKKPLGAKTVRKFRDMLQGRAYEKYKTFIHNRARIDIVNNCTDLPFEKSFITKDGKEVPAFSKWWVEKKVRDMKIKDWLKEYSE